MEKEIFRNFLHIKSLEDLNYSKIGDKDIFVKKEKDFDINLPKFLYREIGKDYYWKDRLFWSDKNWSDYVSQSGYQLHTLYKDKNLVGYYEVLSDNYLNFEIAYFGIFKEFFGRKMGANIVEGRMPESRDSMIINGTMWRNILCHGAMQISVLLGLLFQGRHLFGINYRNDDPFYPNAEWIMAHPGTTYELGMPTPKVEMYTIIFNAFIMM